MLFRPEAHVRAMEDALTPVRLLSQARCAPRGHFDRENAIWYEIRLIATSLVPRVAAEGLDDQLHPPPPPLPPRRLQRAPPTPPRPSPGPPPAPCSPLLLVRPGRAD